MILEPGKIYVVETDHYLSQKQREIVYDYLYSIVPECEFLVLDGGMKIAREVREEDPGLITAILLAVGE